MKKITSFTKSSKARKTSDFSWRAVVIGSILIFPNSYWAVRRGVMWDGPPDIMSLHYNVVFTVFSLTLLNLLVLKRFFRKFALTQGELLIIYIMLSLVTAIGGFDRLQQYIVLLGQIYWFNTPENEWQAIFSPYLPKWLSVSDKEALKNYYGHGGSTLYVVEHIKPWIVPIVVWSLFLGVIIFVMLCINVIIRKQWIEREKLTYPIIQIPVAMTENGGAKAFFSNKGFWIAFAIAALVDIINTLNIHFPVTPRLPTRGVHFYSSEKPWSGMGWIK